MVVEQGGDYFSNPASPGCRPDVYIHNDKRIGITVELNQGIDASDGDFVVHAGNDVIVTDGWDDAMLEPFRRYKDAGVTCCAATEPGAFIGPPHPMNLITEGMFSPFMMFRRGWKFDEGYYGCYSDSDLVMRHYDAGLRAYRNCAVIIHHLGHVAQNQGLSDRGAWDIAHGERRFYERWGGSPLMMFGMIRSSVQAYGREYEGWALPLHPKPIPPKPADVVWTEPLV